MTNKFQHKAKIGDIETYVNKDGSVEELQACPAHHICEGCVHYYGNTVDRTCNQMSTCDGIIWREAV